LTATDPAAQPGSQAPDTTPDNYLDYAVQQYNRLAAQPPPMSTDVLIAALIGAGDETRANADAVRRLTLAVEQLEKLIADQTEVLRAGLAEHTTTARFPLDVAEDAQRIAEETGG
jgi:hypothetical protein